MNRSWPQLAFAHYKYFLVTFTMRDFDLQRRTLSSQNPTVTLMPSSYYSMGSLLLLLMSGVALTDRPSQPPRPQYCSHPVKGCGAPPGHKHIGPSWWAIGAEPFGATIIGITMSLLVPVPPTDNTGVVVINPALENTNVSDTSDSAPAQQVFQTITASVPPGTCGQSADQWCTFPSIYDNNWQSKQRSDPAVPANTYRTGATVHLNYTYSVDCDGQPIVSQTPVMQGPYAQEPPLAPLSAHAQEAPWQIWLKAECQCQSRGTIPAHRYNNMTIILDRAVPNFGQGAMTLSNSTSSVPQTADGGKTWTIAEIEIDDNYCANDDACDSE